MKNSFSSTLYLPMGYCNLPRSISNSLHAPFSWRQYGYLCSFLNHSPVYLWFSAILLERWKCQAGWQLMNWVFSSSSHWFYQKSFSNKFEIIVFGSMRSLAFSDRRVDTVRMATGTGRGKPNHGFTECSVKKSLASLWVNLWWIWSLQLWLQWRLKDICSSAIGSCSCWLNLLFGKDLNMYVSL